MSDLIVRIFPSRSLRIPRHTDGKPIISEMIGFSSMADQIGSDPDWMVEHTHHRHNSWLKLMHLPTGAVLKIKLEDSVAEAAAEQRQQYRNDPEGTPEFWVHDSDEEEEVEPAHDYDGEIDF
jgi:hypothetical protein